MPYLNTVSIESALQALANNYPSICELITLPNTTAEGRTSHAVRIGMAAANTRDCVLFAGSVHAREWGGADICINFAADLLEAYALNTGLTYGGKSFTSAEIQSIVQNLNIIVFPCVNPDGREYSQNTYAMWRRNRNPAPSGGDPHKIGVDLNRNYDFLWDYKNLFDPYAYDPANPESLRVSDTPGSDVYHGQAPFSEAETKNVKWLMDTYPRIKWFVDIHSYSQLVLHHWGDDDNQSTDPNMNFLNSAYNSVRGILGDTAYKEYTTSCDWTSAIALGNSIKDAIKAVRNKTYVVEPSIDLYPTSGIGPDYAYSRHFVDPSKSNIMGFTIEWGMEFQPPWSEMEEIIKDVCSGMLEFCLSAPCMGGAVCVEKQTPTLSFVDVPEGETTSRAVVFKVISCSAATFQIISGPTVTSGPPGTIFGTPWGTSITSPPTGDIDPRYARVWISYTGTNDGDSAAGTVTIKCVETNEEWIIPITSNTVSRPTAAVLSVFDQSNSMSFDSGLGPGITRGDVLKFSAPPLVDVIDDDNAIGIISFDHDPHDVMPVTPVVPVGRITANGHIAGYSHNPNGWTSIGEAVARAHDLLDPVTGYDVKAMIVLTDGRENHDGYSRRYISDVAGLINEHVYAIGLGTAENIQPSALQALCDGHEGYLLMTGALDADAYFRVAKYYQQILAGVENKDIIVDPEGWVKHGQTHRIPFRINETDISSDVILLTPAPYMFKFSLETPAGDVIDPGVAAANPVISYLVGSDVSYYRLTLPVPIGGGEAREGTWHAVLTIDDKYYERYLAKLDNHPEEYQQVLAHGVRYNLNVHCYSNLRLRASLSQTSYEPGAKLMLRAVITEYGLPVESRANVRSELERPDNTTTTLTLAEVEPGVFETSTLASMSGIYRFRVLGTGQTLRGRRFTREQTLTGAVWTRGDEPPPSSKDDPQKRDERLCKLLTCLMNEKVMGKYLAEKGINVEALKECLKSFCGDPQPIPKDGLIRIRPEITQVLADPRVSKALSDLLKLIGVS